MKMKNLYSTQLSIWIFTFGNLLLGLFLFLSKISLYDFILLELVIGNIVLFFNTKYGEHFFDLLFPNANLEVVLEKSKHVEILFDIHKLIKVHKDFDLQSNSTVLTFMRSDTNRFRMIVSITLHHRFYKVEFVDSELNNTLYSYYRCSKLDLYNLLFDFSGEYYLSHLKRKDPRIN